MPAIVQRTEPPAISMVGMASGTRVALCSIAAFCLASSASNPAITAPIIGARDTDQLAPSLAALDIPMTEELRQEIAALSPTPPPATDRLEEQG